MDDLLGEDWNAAKAKAPAPSKVYNNPLSSYPGLRPTPSPSLSNAPTPIPPQLASRPSSAVNSARSPVKSSTPGNDSFAGLLNINSNKTANNLSIQERQKQLLEEKRRQEAEQRQRSAGQFGANEAAFWDNLGSGTGTPVPRNASPFVATNNGTSAKATQVAEDEDDILAAFNSNVPVDKSSHFPVPESATTSNGGSRRNTPIAAQGRPVQRAGPASNALLGDDDDDPFGLGNLPQRSSANSRPNGDLQDDDDILGDLAKPVAPKPPPTRHTVDDAFDLASERTATPPDSRADPQDRAVAELVDMGFPADNARIALAETNGSVQAAVSWLLTQAHETSKARSQGSRTSHRTALAENGHGGARSSSERRSREPQDSAMPAWMRQEQRSSSAQHRGDADAPGHEKDVGKYAQEIGTSLFKSANSLWKQGRKQITKAVQEFNTEHDPNQPKWMRDGAADPYQERPRAEPRPRPDIDATDEAMMLEGGGRPPKPARPGRAPDAFHEPRRPSPAQDLPVRSHAQPRQMPQQPLQDKRPATKLSRQDVEAQSEQAYISPARRKRPPPKAEPQPEVDLFSPAPVHATAPHAAPKASASAPPAARVPPRAATPPRPKAPLRNIPAVSPAALSTSANHRKAGGEAFKRGDYDAAHISYTAALTPLPETHPLVIIVLSNRALTSIKTGDPKLAVADADKVLTLIGPSRGEGEKIEVGQGEEAKEMRDFFGKALTRKAEALEAMEKWSDAANVWKLCVEAGVGGAVSIRGRDRCEKAAGNAGGIRTTTKPTAAKTTPSAPTRKPAPRPAARKAAIDNTQHDEAVKKLREANAAADKADDEKFALTDQVDAKLVAWKGGKTENLRALLGSMDTVLWPESGWKKVGMSELVLPNKVKIVYMKAIAKVHPDKIPQDATTEQRMISGAVFSTLNEAWDKFKKDNNL